jgi:hypothetical protein
MHAGFEDAELVIETGFNSSPVTKGVLVRAVKPLAVMLRKRTQPTAPVEDTEVKPSIPSSGGG